MSDSTKTTVTTGVGGRPPSDLHASIVEIGQTAVQAAGVAPRINIQMVPGSSQRRFLLSRIKTTHDQESDEVVEAVETEILSADCPRRAHQLHSVGEVARFVAFAKSSLLGNPTVYVSESRIVIVIDDGPQSYRDSTAFVDIENTPEHDLLLKLSRLELQQRALVRLLRVDLADCATASSQQLLSVARKLIGTSSSKSTGEVRGNKESIGRDIESEILSSAGDVPEETEFSLRLFTDPELHRKHPIRVPVEWDPQTLTCLLLPRPADLRNAIDEELAGIYRRLEADCDCPIFLGSPEAE